jgi:hypothetical protein
LSDAEVTAFLEANLAPKPGTGELKERVVRAQGAIGMALSDDAGAASARRAAAGFIDEVLAGPGEGGAAVRALGQTPWAARGEFTAMLDAMVETLSDATRVSLGQGSMRPVPPHWLQNRGAASFLAATERVVAAREAAQGNVNPQLLLATLADELAGAL